MIEDIFHILLLLRLGSLNTHLNYIFCILIDKTIG